MDKKYGNIKTRNSGNFYQSLFEAIEVILYDKIKEHRYKGRKVSEYFMHITAKKIMTKVMS